MKKFPSSKYTILPILNESMYMKYCGWIEQIDDLYFEDAKEESKKYAYLDTLTTLTEAYEAKNFKLNSYTLTPPQILRQALDQLNFDKKDLARIIGSNRVSEIFSGKRSLTLNQIRKLRAELKIPADLLVGV